MQAATSGQRLDNVARGLHEFDEHAFTADRKFVVALGMQKTDVMTRSAFANTPGCETDSVRRQPLDGGAQVIDPESDVV